MAVETVEKNTEVKADKADRNKKMAKIVGIVVLILLILFAGMFAIGKYKATHNDDYLLEQSVKAELGELEVMTDNEKIMALNELVEQGQMTMGINMNPVFLNGKSEGTLHIENGKENKYAQEVVITLNETGEVIYRSGLLRPNYFIKEDVLLKDLPQGNYECTATFISYDEEMVKGQQVKVGQGAAKIRISVLE